jgi:LysM repeat protein/D-Tyr-tRNAtyr deacylase
MEFVQRHELKANNDYSYTLIIHLDEHLSEFSDELGQSPRKRSELQTQIGELLKKQFPHVRVSAVKVMAGSLLVASFYFGETTGGSAQAAATQIQQGVQYDEYVVQSGDTLSLLAKKFNVSMSAIQEVNGMTSDRLFVGQTLKLPYFTYTVASGDTLFLLAKRFNTTVDEIRVLNGLTGDVLSIGQKVKIPQKTTNEALKEEVKTPAPAPTPEPEYITYTVVSGDSLSIIAKKFGTTVEAIKAANHLTSDMILVGQTLQIPGKQEAPQPEKEAQTPAPAPEPELITYTVVSGDSLSIIAKRFGTTVEAIKAANNLTTDMIRVGQMLKIPGKEAAPQPEKEAQTPAPTPEPEFITYTVVSGDSLSIIAKRFGTTVEAIKAANHLTSDMILVGQTLQIPGKQAVVPPEREVETPAPEPEFITYTVVSGDTLWKIANKYNTTVAAIKSTNNLTTDMLQVGQTLQIPTEEAVAPVAPVILDAPVLDNSGFINGENQASYVVTGAAEAGAWITIAVTNRLGESISFTTRAGENGNYRLPIDVSSLDDGELVFEVTQTDQAGNISERVTKTLIKDTTAPADFSLDESGFIYSGNESAYHLSGETDPDSIVDITLTDGTVVITERITTGSNGRFEVPVDVRALGDGDISASFTIRDRAGNRTEPETLTIVKDTVPPGEVTLELADFINRETAESFSIVGTDAEEGARVVIAVTDGVHEVSSEAEVRDGAFTVRMDVRELDDGPVTVRITQTDLAGNTSEEQTTSIEKVTNLPEEVTLDLPPYINLENAESFSFTGTGAIDGTRVAVVATDGVTEVAAETEVRDGTFDVSMDVRTLEDGPVSIKIIQTDRAGNTSDVQTTVIEKDTIPPGEATLDVPDFINLDNAGLFTMIGTGSPDGTRVVITFTDGVTEVTEEVEARDGAWGAVLDLSALEDGPVHIRITQTDMAGNVSEVQTESIEKDTVVEQAVVAKSGFSYVKGEPVYTVIGTAEPGATVTVFIDDPLREEPLSASATANASGFYTIHVPVGHLESTADVRITVQQLDRADNLSEWTSVSVHSYIAAAGDTLETIAKRFNTTVAALRSMNNLSADTLQVGQVLSLPASASEVINLGYLYFGNTEHFIHTVNQTSHSVNVVAPSYFDVNRDGTLKLTYQLDTHFIETMHQQGIRVVPFLSNHWDREIGRAMLANKELAATQIADAIERYNLDGVNVDLENITAADRNDFTEFVRLLRELVPAHKEVSVAVAANPNGWNTGWHGAYDYNSLAKYADYLMIMAYDESYQGGDPGPVAGLPWVERSIQYAINQGVPRDKIVIGLAHYGRYWTEGMAVGGLGISNTAVDQMIKRYNGTVEFDEKSQSPKATITIREGDPATVVSGRTLAPGTYTIWFENEESMRQKLALVSKYNIRGVGTWSLGQGNLEVFNSYATTLPTTVPMTGSPVTETEPAPSNYVTYQVVSGDSLWAIANRFGTTIAAIKEANHLTSDAIFAGQTLRIPSNEKAVKEEEVPKAQTYTVVSGDSLWRIANQFGTTVDAIKQANNLTGDSIFVGQVLRIP